LTQIKVYSVTIPASHVPAQSCIDVVGKVAGLTKSDQITGITPPQEFGNLSLNAYAAGADAILFHFCNPSGAEAIAPPVHTHFWRCAKYLLSASSVEARLGVVSKQQRRHQDQCRDRQRADQQHSHGSIVRWFCK